MKAMTVGTNLFALQGNTRKRRAWKKLYRLLQTRLGWLARNGGNPDKDRLACTYRAEIARLRDRFAAKPPHYSPKPEAEQGDD